MRALIVLFALVAMPLVAGVSQVRNKCVNGQSDLHRSAQGTASAHKGLCAPQDPPPPPPPGPAADPHGGPANPETGPGPPAVPRVEPPGAPGQPRPVCTNPAGGPTNPVHAPA